MTIAIPAAGAAPEDRARTTQQRRVAFSCFLGTAIEYYDFTLYGLLAPSVFDQLFFPGLAGTVLGTIVVLSVYFVGFIGRPLGGLVFGWYGDRIGRKPTMVISMTVMGLASTAMGFLPSYASIGAAAPILLICLRVLQGFALGGESSGALVLSTETASAGKRGFFVSLVQSGIFVAWILAVGAATAVALLPQDEFLSWGWRLPFIASIALVSVGIYMRLKVEESAVFLKAVSAHAPARVPLLEVFRHAKKSAIITILCAMAELSSGFFFLVFAYSYALRNLHIDRGTLLQAMLIANIAGFFMAPLFGRLSDRIGRRATIGGAYALNALYVIFAFFPMLSSGNTFLVYLAMFLPIAFTAPMSVCIVGSFYPELFPDARMRFSGVGLGRQVGTALGGGLMPVVATSLVAALGGSLTGAIAYFAAICVVAIAALIAAPETKDVPV